MTSPADVVQQSIARQPPNRLKIAHLLLWTTSTALVAALFRAVVQSSAAGNDLPVLSVSILALSPLLGGGISMLAIASHRRTTGQPSGLTQPGHWLLVGIGIVSIPALALLAVLQFLKWPDTGFFPFGFVFLVISVLVTAILLLGATSDFTSVFWKVALCSAAAQLASPLLLICLELSFLTPAPMILVQVIAPLSLVVAVLSDQISMMRTYDVFHWFGIAAWLAIPLIFAFIALVETSRS